MEKIFRIPSLKTEGLYLTLVQFIFYTVFAKADMIRLKEFRHIPISTYFILAAATMTTMGKLKLFDLVQTCILIVIFFFFFFRVV